MSILHQGPSQKVFFPCCSNFQLTLSFYSKGTLVLVVQGSQKGQFPQCAQGSSSEVIRHTSSALGLESNRGSVFRQNLYSRNNSSFQGLGALLCHHLPSASAVALAVLTAAWDPRARLDSALTRNLPWISRVGVEFIRSVTVAVWDKKFL